LNLILKHKTEKLLQSLRFVLKLKVFLLVTLSKYVYPK